VHTVQRKSGPGIGQLRQHTSLVDPEDGSTDRDQHYRRLVDSVTDCAIIALDSKGGITSWNAGAERIFGHRRGEIVGKPFADLYTAVDVTAGRPDNDLSQTQGQGTCTDDGWRVRRNGSPFWARTALAVLGDEQNGVDGYSLCVQDLAECQPLVDRTVDRTRLEDRLNAVAEVNRAIVEGRSSDNLLHLIASRARELVGATVTTIVTPEPGGDLLVRAADGEDADALRGMRLPASSTLAGEVLRSKRPRVVAGQTPHARPRLTAGRLEAALLVPMIVRSRVIGVIEVANRRGGKPFNEGQMDTVRVFAGLVASIVENAQLLATARVKVALEERQRLARELHDSVSQALYGIALGARTAHEMLARDRQGIREPIEYVLQLADAALAEMRALIFELTPESLEMEGLAGALAKHAEAIRARHDIGVETDFDAVPEASLEIQQALYRIGQEALHNSARHAEAGHVLVRLTIEDSMLALHVIDDGVGFRTDDEFPGHFGLRSMRERAVGVGGSLHVTSGPGRGTHVMARVPAPPPPGDQSPLSTAPAGIRPPSW
jgi:PAS domain S-box-containing protein